MRARQKSAGSDENVNGTTGPGGASSAAALAMSRSPEDVGEIHFSMKYDFQQNTFVVRVIEAKRLPAKDFSGFSGMFDQNHYFLLPCPNDSYFPRDVIPNKSIKKTQIHHL